MLKLLNILLLALLVIGAASQDDADITSPPADYEPAPSPVDAVEPSETPAPPETPGTSETPAPPEPSSTMQEGITMDDPYTKLTQLGSIFCDGAKVRIEIPRDQLVAPIELYTLIDKACKPTVTDTVVSFEFDRTECGSIFESNETHWILSNTVDNVDFHNPPMPGSVMLHNRQQATFRCAYPRVFEGATTNFSSSLVDYEYPLNGLAVSEITLGLYLDEEHNQAVNATYKMKLNTTLYAVLSRRSIGDTGTFIVPSTCSAHSVYSPQYVNPMLSAEGCWVQPNYNYMSHTKDEYLFSFPVFGFLARGEDVKVQCLVRVCRAGQEDTMECKIPRAVCDYGPVDPEIKEKRTAGKAHAIVRRQHVNERMYDSQDIAIAAASFSVEKPVQNINLASLSPDYYDLTTAEEPAEQPITEFSPEMHEGLAENIDIPLDKAEIIAPIVMRTRGRKVDWEH